jgi:hypothetical protein
MIYGFVGGTPIGIMRRMPTHQPEFVLPTLPPLREMKVFGQKICYYDAAGIDEGACEMPVDLRISTRANLRHAFEGMFHDKDKVTDDLVGCRSSNGAGTCRRSSSPRNSRQRSWHSCVPPDAFNRACCGTCAARAASRPA